MSSEKVIASYLRIAAQDLKDARALNELESRNAIYLCSQAAEKVIRAVLTSESIHGGVQHMLNLMVDKVPDENPIKPLLRDIEHLSLFATSFRYPTTKGRVKEPPTNKQFREYADNVEKALDEALKRFDVDLEDQGKAAGNADPIR